MGAALGEQISRDSAAERTVARIHQGTFNYVRIETIEDGAAPNAHPLQIEPEDLARLLAGVRIGQRSLFNEDDLDEVTPHLARALAQATPGQDVSFAVTGKHSSFGFMAARDVTTGRLFNTPAGLQLIVGLAHKPFEDRFRATGYLIPFEPGRRSAPVDAALTLRVAASAAGTMQRPDWISLPTAALAQAAAAPAQVSSAAADAAATTDATAGHPHAAWPGGTDAQAAVPAVAAAPATGSAPASPITGAPQAARAASPAASGAAATRTAGDNEARFLEASERLRTIDRLRNSGLITAQEYELKRKQILQGL